MDKATKREQLIIDTLKMKKKLSTAEVIDLLGISESTARRLFIKLEAEGKALRTHGALQLAGKNWQEYSFDALSQSQEKAAIGKAASDMVKDGDVIFCDAGTTVLCFCMELSKRIKQQGLRLTIVTNSLANLEMLSACAKVTVTGGEYRPHRKDFAGYIAESGLSRLQFTKSFLGVDGYIAPNRLMTTDFFTARMDELAISQSDETVILCDSTKFKRHSLIEYAKVENISCILSDSGVEPQTRAALGGKLIIV